MAGTMNTFDKAVLPKSVDEMSINGNEPPPEYVVKEGTVACIDSLSSDDMIPIIDVSLLSSPDELDKLRSALSSGGCFQAIGHGIPFAFLDKVREVATQFYELPQKEKQKYSRAVSEAEGYGHDLIVSDKQVLDWCSRLSLKVFPEDQRRLNLWPKNPNIFGEVLHEYAIKVKALMEQLYRAMAISLNLEENSFMKYFGEHSLLKSRFNYYPRCSRPDLVLGVKPHSDISGITVLLQDKDVEGLQILKDDKWITVPVISDALVVNLGDQMQIMSNGIFKSPLHRVLTNTQKMRISVATFHEPEPDTEIGPVEALINENTPRLYRNITNYGAIYYECFQKGKVALETVRI